MNNKEFNKVLEESYYVYLETGARSNKKLEVLHGAIAHDIAKRLGSEYEIKSLGYGDGKESKLSGRYMDKNVDISIKKDNEAVAGIAVKFIMSNYSQNSNNYFENMLGETANLRCNDKAYFQIVILPKSVPYFKKGGEISKMEEITENNILKYIKLSDDDTDFYLHTPNKTLFYVIDLPNIDISEVTNSEEYKDYLLSLDTLNIKQSSNQYKFNKSFVYNDYEDFIDKVIHYIKFKG